MFALWALTSITAGEVLGVALDVALGVAFELARALRKPRGI